MKYLVVDGGFMLGKERNILFATNEKEEAIKAAKESGEGVAVIKQNDQDSRSGRSEQIIFISSYQTKLELAE